jgi:hypothetical protein
VHYGYTPTKQSSLGLCHNTNCPVTFSLVIDDFGVKCFDHKHAKHPINTLQELSKITIQWEGELYCGIPLKWDYINCTINIMYLLDCIKKALHQFQVPTPSRAHHSPHAWNCPNYGKLPPNLHLALIIHTIELHETNLSPGKHCHAPLILCMGNQFNHACSASYPPPIFSASNRN